MNLDLSKRARGFLVELPEKSIGLNLFLALAGAFLTSVAAQVAIPLPFTPVPVTMQVFTVFALAALLGPFYGGLSQVIYVSLGMAGLPWYAGGAAGMQLGVTAGYLAGFVAAAGLVGYLCRHDEFRNAQWKIAAAMLAGLVIVYIFGGFHFATVTGSSYRQTLAMTVVPFVIPDLMKVVMASSLVWWVKK
jgi:biotin transport system substrate-specific component